MKRYSLTREKIVDNLATPGGRSEFPDHSLTYVTHLDFWVTHGHSRNKWERIRELEKEAYLKLLRHVQYELQIDTASVFTLTG